MKTLTFLSICLLISGCSNIEPNKNSSICFDNRRQVDINAIALDYSGADISFSAGWQDIALKAGYKRVKLFEISESTKNWNEFVKSVALAHNGCSGDKDTLAKAINKYSEMKGAREIIAQIMEKVPSDGTLSPELQSVLGKTLDRYHQLLAPIQEKALK